MKRERTPCWPVPLWVGLTVGLSIWSGGIVFILVALALGWNR